MIAMYENLTNEELAVRIRAGEKQYLSELYQRTRKLLAHYAKKHRRMVDEYPDITIDDLIQCGYFAFIKAIQSFNPHGTHEFHAYILFPYKNEVYRLLGRHRENSKYVFRSVTYSLNEKEINAEDAPEKQDLLVDDYNLVTEYEKKELAELLETAIEQLPDEERDVIIEIYYFNKKKAQIARERNAHHQSIQRLENRALDLLSMNQALRDYYYSVHSAGVY